MTTLLIVTLGNYSFLKHKWLSFLNNREDVSYFNRWYNDDIFSWGCWIFLWSVKDSGRYMKKTINKFKPYAICFLVLYLFTRIELFFNDGFLPYDWQMENQSNEPTWWRSFSPPAINKRYIKKSENQIHLFFDPSILSKSCL